MEFSVGKIIDPRRREIRIEDGNAAVHIVEPIRKNTGSHCLFTALSEKTREHTIGRAHILGKTDDSWKRF